MSDRATFDRFRHKVARLREQDPDCRKFGSSAHRYRLFEPLLEQRLLDLEQACAIQLPDSVRAFITQFADGGAGPGYGLFAFSSTLAAAAKSPVARSALQKPFRFTTAIAERIVAYRTSTPQRSWETERCAAESDLTTDETGEDVSPFGTLRLVDLGCGAEDVLVLSGEQREMVWCNDQPYDQLWWPYSAIEGRQLGFLDWYEQWLDDYSRDDTP